MATTKTDVANWMIEYIRGRKESDQATVAHQIKLKFGDEWIYTNANGKWAIATAVLAEFRKLHAGTIKWDKAYKSWTNVSS